MPEEPRHERRTCLHAKFQDLQRGDPGIDDLENLEKELYGASDRAVAILLGAFVEAALTKYLQAQLRQDMNSKQRRAVYDYDGPLGTFSAKIAVAYAMSAIGPIFRNDLDLIRILRNGFAHSKKSIKFDDAETAAVCAKLKTPDMSNVRIAVQSSKTATEPDWDKYSDLTKPQNRFRAAAQTISARMLTARQQFEMANALATRPSQLP
jgi:DNA-binding MltR family transcriptional regulator